ncbi:hypothetical protein DFJ73DRAFT_840961 [Zopfochytrium polystomum]|nr:hypothetical protein DFJ73DRAFT_840961 [Zopfochytrium polystomum]
MRGRRKTKGSFGSSPRTTAMTETTPVPTTSPAEVSAREGRTHRPSPRSSLIRNGTSPVGGEDDGDGDSIGYDDRPTTTRRLAVELLQAILRFCDRHTLLTTVVVSKHFQQLTISEWNRRLPPLPLGALLHGKARTDAKSGVWGQIAVFARVRSIKEPRRSWSKATIEILQKRVVGVSERAGMQWLEEEPVRPHAKVPSGFGRRVVVPRRFDAPGVVFFVRNSGLQVYGVPLARGMIKLRVVEELVNVRRDHRPSLADPPPPLQATGEVVVAADGEEVEEGEDNEEVDGRGGTIGRSFIVVDGRRAAGTGGKGLVVVVPPPPPPPHRG